MNITQSILATLHYHDIFSYPLTSDELYKYLITKQTTKSELSKNLDKLIKEKKIAKNGIYYSLKTKIKNVKLRKQRTRYSTHKLKTAFFYSRILKTIPLIQFVGISGALSMQNSTKNDDIDFVIITKKNLLWTTRLMVNTSLFPFKRKPGSTKINNRACLNIFIDESDLKIKTQNLYLAHEICQLLPLWQKNNAYLRFIGANKWIYDYLPNWTPQTIKSQPPIPHTGKKRGVVNLLPKASFISLLETILKNFQLFYMKNKISTETIGERQLFFHPANTQEKVLSEYHKKTRQILSLR